MKKIILPLYFCLYAAISIAQEIPRSQIEDSVLGWMKVYNFKGVKESLKVDTKIYSAAQLSIGDSIANWMQASYIAKGGLSDVKKTVSKKLNDYNQHTAALPQSYGAYATTYVFLKYNNNHKLIPANNLGTTWSIMANAVPDGGSWVIRDFSNPQQCYFTSPSFETSQDPESVKKNHDLTQSPNLKPYISFWVKNIESGGGTDYVLLCKNNKSPFIKLTKGQYLQLLDAAMPTVYQRVKKKIYEANPGNQKSIDNFIKYLDDKNEKRLANLKSTKEKYKNRLGEIALTGAQPSVQDLDDGRDVFSNGYLSDPESTSGRVPVYKIDPVMAELCKTDKPQWILISWWWAANDPTEKHLHESIINNFNFDYVYNFFFDTDKVKGLKYKPLRSPSYKETVVINEASEASKNNKADKNIFFFEDFSTTGVGKTPIGWKSKLNSNGKTCTITTLEVEKGNWVEIKGNESLTASQLKKPLPQNFTISYELVVPQNFTWGGKGLAFQLSKETSPGNAESYLNLRIRPGSNGSDGEAVIDTKFASPPGYLNGTKWVTAPGFSNNKKNNHITVTIKKIEVKLQLFIDKNKIAEYEKAIPAALLFNSISFSHGRSDGETEKFYISNIKITKD
ncbi:MAG: hypothetical protein ABIP79_15550 [Chitinophagaceae bacterium]